MLIKIKDLLKDERFGSLFEKILPEKIKNLSSEDKIIISYNITEFGYTINKVYIRKYIDKKFIEKLLIRANNFTYLTDTFDTQTLFLYNFLKQLINTNVINVYKKGGISDEDISLMKSNLDLNVFGDWGWHDDNEGQSNQDSDNQSEQDDEEGKGEKSDQANDEVELEEQPKELHEELSNQLDEFFRWAKMEDLKKIENINEIKRKNDSNIIDVNDFSKYACGYIKMDNKENIALLSYMEGLLNNLDLIYKEYFNANLFGETIVRVVSGVRDTVRGFIPVENGYMRTMYIGEKSVSQIGKDFEKIHKKLNIANELLTKNTVQEIFLKTGWFYNSLDKKFRYFLSDENVSIKFHKFKLDNGNYLPIKFNNQYLEDVKNFIEKGSINSFDFFEKYPLVLGDILEYTELYKFYPHLKFINVVITVSKDLKESILYYNDRDKYFSFNFSNYKFRIIGGLDNYLNSVGLPTMLHEIQHYIQKIEGFAQGGNTVLGQMAYLLKDKVNIMDIMHKVNSVSSYLRFKVNYTNVDNIIFGIENMQNKVAEIDKELNTKIEEYLSKIFTIKENLKKYKSEKNDKEIKNSISGLVNAIMGFGKIFSKFFNFNVKYKYEIKDYYIKIFEWLPELIKEDIQDIFEAINKYGLYLSNYVDNPIMIERFDFYNYFNILGEVESRETESMLKVPKEFRGYFLPYTSENIPTENLLILSDNEIIEYFKGLFNAGLEMLNNKKTYIFHNTEKNDNLGVVIHELGHIFYDRIKEIMYVEIDDIINQAISKQNENIIKRYKSKSEFFSNYFVYYISQTKTVKYNKQVKEHFNKFFIYYIGHEFKTYPELDKVLDKLFVEGFEKTDLYFSVYKKYIEDFKKLLD